MQLSTYLQKHNVTPTEFAAKLRISRQAVWRYMSGERLPHRDIMARIEDVTGGKVKPADFFTTPSPNTKTEESAA